MTPLVTPAAVGMSAAASARLGRLLTIDALITVGGTVMLLATWVFELRSGVVLGLAASVGGGAVVMALGHLPHRRGRPDVALGMLAGANWALSIVVSLVATFAWPIMLVATLLPPAMAVPHVDRRTLYRYVAGSMVIGLGVAALGSLQDVTGFSDEMPLWLRQVVVVCATPCMAFLVAFVAFQSLQTIDESQRLLAEHAEALQRSRSRLVEVADDQRRAIERDLHDGAQQRLTAVAVGIGRLAERSRKGHPPDAAALDALRSDLAQARAELRNLARGVYPASLSQLGLVSTLRQVFSDAPVPVLIDADTDLNGPDRLPIAASRAVYFCCLEAVQNTTVHATRRHTVVNRIELRTAVTANGRELRFSIADDGPGFDPTATAPGRGLQNMADRIGAVGGSLQVRARPDEGTAVVGTVPLTEA
jgi:signal transduction histidine kinase